MQKESEGKADVHEALPETQDTTVALRRMDAKIAVEVMGFDDIIQVRKLKNEGMWAIMALSAPHMASFDYSQWWGEDGTKYYCGNPHTLYNVPRYSTSIADAWLVVEKLREMGLYPDIISHGSGPHWQVVIDHYCEDKPCACPWGETADTAPEAICLAALKAVSHD